MFSLQKPAESEIAQFINQQRDLDFSYPQVGATQQAPPPGYVFNQVRTELGTGAAAFTAARVALLQWRQFHTGWTTLYPSHAPIEPGQTVAVLARTAPLWSLNSCRIVYAIDEQGPVTRFGFGYGTLPGHAEAGEERFLIEWHRDSDAVFYDVLAFFRPNHILTRLGWFYGLRLVNRFRRDSAQAMKDAVR